MILRTRAYRRVRRQIEKRVVELGYSKSRFEHIDRRIAEESLAGASAETDPKTDRYGKKYSWIAYFEMYGLRREQGLVGRVERRPTV